MKKLMVLLPTKETIVIQELERIWTQLDWGRSVAFGKAKYVLCYEDAKYKQYVMLVSHSRDALEEVGMLITKAYAEGKEFIDLYHDEEE